MDNVSNPSDHYLELVRWNVNKLIMKLDKIILATTGYQQVREQKLISRAKLHCPMSYILCPRTRNRVRAFPLVKKSAPTQHRNDECIER